MLSPKKENEDQIGSFFETVHAVNELRLKAEIQRERNANNIEIGKLKLEIAELRLKLSVCYTEKIDLTVLEDLKRRVEEQAQENIQKNSEIANLKGDLAVLQEEMFSKSIVNENKLKEKAEELRNATLKIQQLTETNQIVTKLCEENSIKIKGQTLCYGNLLNAYEKDLDASIRLADTYKKKSEEYSARVDELRAVVKNLQSQVNKATYEKGMFETKSEMCEECEECENLLLKDQRAALFKQNIISVKENLITMNNHDTNTCDCSKLAEMGSLFLYPALGIDHVSPTINLGSETFDLKKVINSEKHFKVLPLQPKNISNASNKAKTSNAVTDSEFDLRAENKFLVCKIKKLLCHIRTVEAKLLRFEKKDQNLLIESEEQEQTNQNQQLPKQNDVKTEALEKLKSEETTGQGQLRHRAEFIVLRNERNRIAKRLKHTLRNFRSLLDEKRKALHDLSASNRRNFMFIRSINDMKRQIANMGKKIKSMKNKLISKNKQLAHIKKKEMQIRTIARAYKYTFFDMKAIADTSEAVAIAKIEKMSDENEAKDKTIVFLTETNENLNNQLEKFRPAKSSDSTLPSNTLITQAGRKRSCDGKGDVFTGAEECSVLEKTSLPNKRTRLLDEQVDDDSIEEVDDTRVALNVLRGSNNCEQKTPEKTSSPEQNMDNQQIVVGDLTDENDQNNFYGNDSTAQLANDKNAAFKPKREGDPEHGIVPEHEVKSEHEVEPEREIEPEHKIIDEQ